MVEVISGKTGGGGALGPRSPSLSAAEIRNSVRIIISPECGPPVILSTSNHIKHGITIS